MPRAALSRKSPPSRRAAAQLEAHAADAARLLKLLANDQRLIVLCRLSDKEMSVSELGRHLSLSQSALSQHLAKLRADGLVETRREGQTIYYRLADPIAEKIVGLLCDLYSGKAK
jgi:DNA-binding transcriptional ArsR family regulator